VLPTPHIMSALTTDHRRALIWLLLANLFWGLSFPVIKGVMLIHGQLVPGSGNWFITAMTLAPRFGLAALVLAIVLRGRLGAMTGLEWRQGLLLGGFNAAGMLLQVDGLQFTDASVSAFLTQLSAILIPVVVAIRLRRRPSVTVGCCALLVLAGVAILGRFDFRALKLGRGECETLLSSVFFMGQIFLVEDKRFAGNRVVLVSTVMFALEGLVFAALALATAGQAADCLVPWSNGPWLASTALLTGFCTLGAFLLMNRWQPKITATEAGLIYCFEPLFASVMALFLPALISRWAGLDYANETLTWQLLVGGGLITVANVWLQVRPGTKG
jgi:drug/metabolite transporter (DMT)-like permease